MAYGTITVRREGNIATITLNRPERLNAVNWNMYQELVEALDDCDYDDDIRAVVITGAGRAFCSGEDLKGFFQDANTRIPKGDKLATDGYIRLCKALLDLPKPVIAAINGHALGVGFELCLACDFRIASENATFAFPLVLRGLAAFTVLLPRYVGITKATEMLLLGERIDAREAERLGIVNRVVPAEQLEDAAKELAAKLAKGATKAMGLLKKALNQGFAAKYDFEARIALQSEQTEDAKEGVRAFVEKREPKFTGR